MNTKTMLISAAVIGLLAGSANANAEKGKKAKPVKDKVAVGECHGVNSCKGKGECGGAGHSCAGKNSCKGKGWIKLSKAECDEKNGEFKAEQM